MQTAAVANQEVQSDSSPDTLFGVCYSIGQDFGFNPFYLRIALIGLGVFSLAAAVGTYAALGLTVGLSRMMFPAASKPAATQHSEAISEEYPQDVAEVRERELVAA